MKAKLDFFTKALSCALVAGVSFACSTANAQTTVIDDFSGALSGYTTTVILDAQNAGSNEFEFATNDAGQLVLNTTAYDGIEQYAFIRNGVSLGVGSELQLDLSDPVSGNRNLGLYVGGVAPVTSTFPNDPRSTLEYISVYGAANGAVATRGFDSGRLNPDGSGNLQPEYNNTQVFPDYDSIFIARTDVNTFEVGTYLAGVRSVFETRNPVSANTADFIGIYADVRAAGTVGVADNLRIVTAVPEPSSLALLGLASIAGLARRRKR